MEVRAAKTILLMTEIMAKSHALREKLHALAERVFAPAAGDPRETDLHARLQGVLEGIVKAEEAVRETGGFLSCDL